MDCSKYYEMVSEEVDGELPESESLGLMRHLVKCPDCLNGYKTTINLREVIKKESFNSHLLVPDEFSKNVIEMISGSEKGTHIEYDENKQGLADFISNIKEFIKLPRPSYAFSLALSLVLVVSLTFIIKESGKNGFSPEKTTVAELTNAKTIKAEVLKPELVTDFDNEEDELNYYVKRHSNVVVRKTVGSHMSYRDSGFSYANFGSSSAQNR